MNAPSLQEMAGLALVVLVVGIGCSDHTNGGSPTLLLKVPEQAQAALDARLPESLRKQLVVRPVDWTLDQLMAAVGSIRDIQGIGSVGESPTMHTIGLDIVHNTVVIGVRPGTDGEGLISRLERVVPVAVTVRESEAPVLDTCSRSSCWPWRAGIGVSNDGGLPSSTLGFAVSNGGAGKGYLIAGHQSGTYFYHNGTYVGVLYESLFPGMLQDAKFIDAYDGYVNNDLYVTSTYTRDVVATRNPSVGLYVCMSGIKSGVRCGTVTDDWTSWYSNGNYVFGASANYYSQGGDSGAPVYQAVSGDKANAVGIHSAHSGSTRYFARMDQILGAMSASLVTN